MNTESKRRAWYDKIYRKFEPILVEANSLASQGKASLESSDPAELDSVKDEPQKLTEDHCSGISDTEQQRSHELSRQICKSSYDPPLDHKLQNVRLEEQLQGDSLKDKLSDSVLIEEHCAQTSSFMTAITCNDDTFVSPSGFSMGDSNLIPFATEIQAAPVKDKVANATSFSSNFMTVNQDEFFIEDFHIGPLDTIDLYDMTCREDPSDYDDNLLYAVRDRTKQLRSFKRKIMDAITSKRRREKEYEQLAIWFGDADMGCDLKEHASTSLNSKSSQSNVASEDSEWELL